MQWTFLGHPLAELDDMQKPFSSAEEVNGYHPLGYVIDSGSGLPTFRYRYKDVEVENKIIPADNIHLEISGT